MMFDVDCTILQEIEFHVPGIPQPKGSLRAIQAPRQTRPFIIEDSKRSKPWRTMIVSFASEKRPSELWRGPVELEITFQMPRPKSHYGTGRNAAKIRRAAPPLPIKKPDIDKLERNILDALTSIFYVDDSQVISVSTRKRFGNPGCTIVARLLDEDAFRVG